MDTYEQKREQAWRMFWGRWSGHVGHDELKQAFEAGYNACLSDENEACRGRSKSVIFTALDDYVDHFG